MSFKNTMLAVFLIFSAVLAQACLHDGDEGSAGAQSGVTRAEFDALAAQVAALMANQPGDKVVSGSVSAVSASSFQKAAAAGGKPLGTAVGFLPGNVPAFQSRQFVLKSSTGYLYAVPNESNINGGVGIGVLADSNGDSEDLYFAAADCSGQPYASKRSISEYGAQQGFVFRLHAGEFNATIDNPAQYFYIAAGTTRVDSFAYQSRTSNIDKCTIESGTLIIGAFPALPNDAAVTAVDSAPVPTPVTLETPPAA